MARLFDNASAEYATQASALVSDVPLTMACWFNADETTNVLTLMSIGDDAGDADYHRLFLWGSNGDQVGAQSQATSGSISSTGTYLVDTWHHGAAVFAASNSRTAYFDGTAATTETTNRSITNLDATMIGRNAGNNVGSEEYMSGLIAEAGFWNVGLTGDEIASLAGGVSPLLVRPASLLGYWPLFGIDSPEPDFSGRGNAMTLVNTPAAGGHAPTAPQFGHNSGEEYVIAAAGGVPPGMIGKDGSLGAMQINGGMIR